MNRILGLIFALALCPISEALFFGTLVPLSIEYGSNVLLPLLYGVGTGLPGVVFIAIGIYFRLKYSFRAF